MKKRYFLPFIFLVITTTALSAFDFGLILDNSVLYEAGGFEKDLKYKGILVSWFSSPLGSSGKFHFSASVTADYSQKEWSFVPELLLTEVKWRFEKGQELSIGRTAYRDPLGFIANGLFDGFWYQQDAGGGALGFGAFYTGLQYKKSANITMTEEELDSYNEDFDYGNFYNTYFAPPRILAALDYQHPGLGELIRFSLSMVGQFDLNGGDKLYHSVYLIGKLGIPVGAFIFDIGACAAAASASERFNLSFAGELGIGWYLPTSIQDRLMLSGRLSCGTVNSWLTAFVPVTTETQGNILKAKLSGLSIVQLDYTARFHEALSLSLSSSYYILSDLATYQGLPAGRDGHFLGNEFYGLLTWSPFSDLQLKAGGGAFLPSLGNADKQAEMLWQLEFALVVALF